MSIRERIRRPPSDLTGELGFWMNDLWLLVNGMPVVSYFSGTDPNSNVTGLAGDILINIGSASTSTRGWIKGSALTTLTMTDWHPLRIG